MNITEIEHEIDKLVSDLACCNNDRRPCRCFQAVRYLSEIRDYAAAEVERHGKNVGFTESTVSVSAEEKKDG